MASAGDSQQAEGSKRHRAHVKMMAEAAKARRAAKGRGHGKRYCYNGIKGVYPSVDKPLAILSGKAYEAA